jgi:NAD(P)-dependent dehydrogenase (short-subunit alcohol dehydrogenase family)
MITGASAGVGRATAVAFARRGARIGLLARGRAGLDAALRDVREAGGDGVTIEADVADADAVERGAAALEAAFGPIDVWVNNAMASVFSPVVETTADEFRRVTEVTYLGIVHGTLSALRRMRPRNEGAIVQVGSALAYRGIPLQAAYCAAKHAVQGFCESLRTELIQEGSRIRLTMVQLPALNTPQFEWVKSRLPNRPQPVPPIYQPEVAADAIVWAAGQERREVYVGLPTVIAILGNKIAPALGDAYLARTGFGAQQTAEPEAPGRPDNLRSPVDADRDFGARGRFDARAWRFSPQLWATMHRGAIAVAAAVAAVPLVAAIGRRGNAG